MTKPEIESLLSEYEALASGATRAPWEIDPDFEGGIAHSEGRNPEVRVAVLNGGLPSNKRFIVWCRNNVPTLVAHLKDALAEVETAKVEAADKERYSESRMDALDLLVELTEKDRDRLRAALDRVRQVASKHEFEPWMESEAPPGTLREALGYNRAMTEVRRTRCGHAMNDVLDRLEEMRDWVTRYERCWCGRHDVPVLCPPTQAERRAVKTKAPSADADLTKERT